jgi:hypothetical protein
LASALHWGTSDNRGIGLECLVSTTYCGLPAHEHGSIGHTQLTFADINTSIKNQFDYLEQI